MRRPVGGADEISQVQHLWAFEGICGGGMPAETLGPFANPSPMFPAAPSSSLPSHIRAQLSGRGPDLVWHRTGAQLPDPG